MSAGLVHSDSFFSETQEKAQGNTLPSFGNAVTKTRREEHKTIYFSLSKKSILVQYEPLMPKDSFAVTTQKDKL